MDRKDLLKLFGNDSKARRYNFGELIVGEGNLPTEGLGFLVSGEARVFQVQSNTPVTIGTVKSGQFFGESSMVLSRPRMASVECTSAEAVVIFLSKEHFLKETIKNAPLLEMLINQTIQRVDYVETLLARTHITNEIMIDPSLNPIIEYNRMRNLQLIALLNHTRSAWVGGGKTVFAQGDKNDEQTYLVVKGQIQAYKHDGNIKRPFMLYKEGDVFGYARKQTSPYRRFTALASSENARIICFDDDLLNRLMKINPEAFFYIFRSIVTHLVVLNDAYRISSAKKDLSPGREDTMKQIMRDLGSCSDEEESEEKSEKSEVSTDEDTALTKPSACDEEIAPHV